MDIRTLGVKGYSVSAAANRRGDFSNLLKPVLEAPALRTQHSQRLRQGGCPGVQGQAVLQGDVLPQNQSDNLKQEKFGAGVGRETSHYS